MVGLKPHMVQRDGKSVNFRYVFVLLVAHEKGGVTILKMLHQDQPAGFRKRIENIVCRTKTKTRSWRQY